MTLSNPAVGTGNLHLEVDPEHDHLERLAPLDRVLDALERQAGGAGVRCSGSGWVARCPAHDDHDPSLSIREGDEQPVVLYCHAGCTSDAVVDALGLSWSDLSEDRPASVPTASQAPAAGPAHYVYRDGDGREIGKVVRGPDKRFHQQRKVGEHWESGGSAELNHTPYRLPELLASAESDAVVYVVEGERDADTAIERWGVVATCNAGGAGKWRPEHARHMAGRSVIVVQDRDDPGRQHAAAVADSLRGLARDVSVVEPRAGKDLTDHAHAGYGPEDLVRVPNQAAASAEAGPAPVTVSLADVAPERLAWLWPGRLPAGKLVTLDGDPSVGKSTLAVTLAAHVSTGRPWPDGAPCETGAVVILSAEDGLADTIRPRLDAAGGDPARVHAITAIRTGERERAVTLADVAAIRDTIHRVRARLLIVDVLMAYMPGKVDAHKDQDVRTVLHQVAALAEATGCTVILLRHLNKSAGGSPMYRGGGSIGIVGAARAGYVVALDPDDPEVRVLACIKSNLAQMPDSLAYRLESAPGTDVARVAWSGTSERGAADLLRGDRDGGDERREIDRWLEDLFIERGGALAANDAYRAAEGAGYSRDQVKRAKVRLGAKARKSGGAGEPWMWCWDPGEPKGAKSAPSETPPPSPPLVLPSPEPSGVAESERCTRCRQPSPHPLILGLCRSCAYPPGTDSPHRPAEPADD
ncbi:AAA family ATPase [Pseudonocardia halophobica]|uniref:AAA family ATPase n=1 Tax=Pseudonocardia halophobica TaxID=29401 RepID=UPI003D8E8CBD